MALQHKFSRLLSQSDFDLLNEKYGLNLEYDSAFDYRHAQVIWNLHAKVEELAIEIETLKRKDQKSLKSPGN